MRIGILDCSSPHWTAGEVYTRTLLAALAAADRPAATELLFFRSNAAIVPPSGIEICEIGASPNGSLWPNLQKSLAVDVLLPLQNFVLPPYKAAIGWIPDFQHIHMPHLFSKFEAESRNRTYAQLAEGCEKIIVSSRAVARDFSNLYPQYSEKTAVLPFPSLFAAQQELSEVGDTLNKYRLPREFALIPNQFWAHKNHAILPPALATLRNAGKSLPVVLTGAPADYRDPSNSVVSDFFQAVAQHGVHNDIYMLGAVSRDELLDLLRSTSLIIQPSLSEGWNTTLEDAKALGVPIACSDLHVHREQCGTAAFYFDPKDASSLAEALGRVWSASVDAQMLRAAREARSLQQARLHLKEWGEGILETATSAYEACLRPRSAKTAIGNRFKNECRKVIGKLKRAVSALRN